MSNLEVIFVPKHLAGFFSKSRVIFQQSSVAECIRSITLNVTYGSYLSLSPPDSADKEALSAVHTEDRSVHLT